MSRQQVKKKKKIQWAYLIRPQSVLSAHCRRCVTLKRVGRVAATLRQKRRNKREKRAYLLRPWCVSSMVLPPSIVVERKREGSPSPSLCHVEKSGSCGCCKGDCRVGSGSEPEI